MSLKSTVIVATIDTKDKDYLVQQASFEIKRKIFPPGQWQPPPGVVIP
jgi:hypothetical protein